MDTLVERFTQALTIPAAAEFKQPDEEGEKGLHQNLPSWEALARTLEARPEIRGESFSKAKLRLFGDDNEPALTFYRDDSGWCPFCEYIWIALEEKKISYAVKKIHLTGYGRKPDWYFDIVPSGIVPGIEINGEIVGTESAELLYSLEERFPHHRPLLPAAGSAEREAVNDLVKLQEEFSREWKQNFVGGWKSVDKLEGILTKIDSALLRFGGPYFLGKEVFHSPLALDRCISIAWTCQFHPIEGIFYLETMCSDALKRRNGALVPLLKASTSDFWPLSRKKG